jgi:hypothetical protein
VKARVFCTVAKEKNSGDDMQQRSLLRGRRKIEEMLDTAKVRRAELVARKDVLPDIAPTLDWLDRKISNVESLASLQADLELAAEKESELGAVRAMTEQP